MRFQDTKFWQNYNQYDKRMMRSSIDAVVYWRLLNYFKFDTFLEIGVHQGLTTGLMFESAPTARVTAIDPFNKLELFYKNYPEYQNQFTFIRKSSQAVDLGNATYDFILIDGNHDYLPAKNDILKCLPRLAESGILAIDDYQCMGVASAIQDLYQLKTDWVPFLRSAQTEFWHHRGCDRSKFLDSLFTDPISKFIFLENVVDQYNNTICVAKTLSIFTDHPEYFNMALQHYNI